MKTSEKMGALLIPGISGFTQGIKPPGFVVIVHVLSHGSGMIASQNGI
jgi:hypothetical protein